MDRDYNLCVAGVRDRDRDRERETEGMCVDVCVCEFTRACVFGEEGKTEKNGETTFNIYRERGEGREGKRNQND